jgi:hypothetical protein
MNWKLMGGWTAALLMGVAVASAAPPYRVPATTVSHGGLVHGPTCGCDACHVACDPCCRPCILRVIPAVVHGVDRLLNDIFTCKRCYRPACGVGCGCGAPHGGEWIGPHDMPQVEPEPLQSQMSAQMRRSYEQWNISPRSTGIPSARTVAPRPAAPTNDSGLDGTTSVMKSKRTSSLPARIPARSTSLVRPQVDEVREIENVVAEPVEELRPVRRTSYTTESAPRIPKNPLRDN